jgi:hypothetical protein
VAAGGHSRNEPTAARQAQYHRNRRWQNEPLALVREKLIHSGKILLRFWE